MAATTDTETHDTMALECLGSAFRKICAASILIGEEPPSLKLLDAACQDYQAAETREEALTYALATVRQAIHLFTKNSFAGGA